MPADRPKPIRRRPPPDPRELLVRALDRLSDRSPYVTLADLEKVASRPSSRLAAEGLADLVAAAVAESLVLQDRRTFYDRKTGTTSAAWVYRVNVRHPLAAALLDDA
jgi:hypothetical protein